MINYSHLFPTRYALELEGLKNSVAAEHFKEPSQREDARKTIKKLFEERYQTGKNKWFFQALRVGLFMMHAAFRADCLQHSSDRSFLYLWCLGDDLAKLHVHHICPYMTHAFYAPLHDISTWTWCLVVYRCDYCNVQAQVMQVANHLTYHKFISEFVKKSLCVVDLECSNVTPVIRESWACYT